MNEPSIHEQFREIWDFVHRKCEEESKLILLHALDEEAPECECVVGPAKIQAWEDPAVKTELPAGIPAKDVEGNYTNQANICPFCAGWVWVSIILAAGATVTCLSCHGKFRRVFA